MSRCSPVVDPGEVAPAVPAETGATWSGPAEGYRSEHTLRNKLARGLWDLVWLALFRPSPRVLHGWRAFLLRLFGARIGRGTRIYPSARIWAPWNLRMGDHSCLGPDVDCYSVALIELHEHAVVSQYCHLCSASHDYTRLTLPLITAPIRIGRAAWVTAGVFIGLGVQVGEGAVIGARSVVTRHVEPWTVVAGNPARFLKRRVLKEE